MAIRRKVAVEAENVRYGASRDDIGGGGGGCVGVGIGIGIGVGVGVDVTGGAHRGVGQGVVATPHAPPPSRFLCPISCDVMESPVQCADGITYEARCIQEWLERSSMSPMTGEELVSLDLQPDEDTAIAIATWRAAAAPCSS